MSIKMDWKIKEKTQDSNWEERKGSRLGLMVKEDNCNFKILLQEKFEKNIAKCQQLFIPVSSKFLETKQTSPHPTGKYLDSASTF